MSGAVRCPHLTASTVKDDMGKRNRSQVTEASLFFVTTSLRDWKPLFSDPETAEKVEKFLFELFPSYADALFGYVIMPSHLHLMVGCCNGGGQLSEFMRTLKSLTSRRFFPQSGSVWMDRFDDLRIITEKQFLIKLTYIHNNPVRKGLVESPLHWPWSSARFWILGEKKGVLTNNYDFLLKD